MACAAAGIALSLSGNNGSNGHVIAKPTACEFEAIGGEPSLLTKPWEPANPQWLLGVVIVVTLMLRQYVIPFFVRRYYGALPAQKQVKISNYVLELIGTSLALAVTSASGLWRLLFDPSAYEPAPSVEQSYSFVVGLQILLACFIPMYVLELAFDDKMRSGLALHHWTALLLTLWGALVIHKVGLSIWMVRTFFAMSLYMSTEQNVFIEMLAYHQKVYWPICYSLSAWYYLVTRVVVTILSLWSWWGCYDLVFHSGSHNSPFVYALWLFVPFANAILNATQLTTVSSLFGIASTVRKRLQVQQEELFMEKELSAASSGQEMTATKTELDGLQFTSMLHDVFDQIDVDDSGCISFAEWQAYVKSMEFDLIVPNWAIARLFDSVDVYGNGQIDWLAFERFFSGFATSAQVGFKPVFMGALIKSMLEANIDSNFRALLAYKYQAVVDDIQRQSGSTLGSSWALLPRVSWGDIESSRVMEKSWTEPGAFKTRRAASATERSIFV